MSDMRPKKWVRNTGPDQVVAWAGCEVLIPQQKASLVDADVAQAAHHRYAPQIEVVSAETAARYNAPPVSAEPTPTAAAAPKKKAKTKPAPKKPAPAKRRAVKKGK